jgi:hypothetical protein
MVGPSDLRGSVNIGPRGWTWVEDMARQMPKGPDLSTLNGLMQVLDTLKFLIKDVVEFEKKYEFISKAKATGSTENETPKDYEGFIRSLRVWYENDLEIKIQVPEKSAKPYGYAPLGFRSPTDIAWRDLLEILENSDHTYHVGPAYKHFNADRQRVGDYDKKLRRLDQISHKFIRFVENNFGLQAPKGFKFYEKRKGDKPGTYDLKFQILDGSLQDTDRQLMLKVQDYEKKTKLSQKEKDDLADLIIEVQKRRLMSNEDIKNKFEKLAKTYKGKEEIKYDPYENKENLDQD